jgi:hypothetical protein
MRTFMLGIAGLALIAPPALAQQPPGPPPTSAVSQQTEPGRYWVFFGFDRSDLRPEARAVVAEAAESFKRTGSTHISLVGNARDFVTMALLAACIVAGVVVTPVVPVMARDYGASGKIPLGAGGQETASGNDIRDKGNWDVDWRASAS